MAYIVELKREAERQVMRLPTDVRVAVDTALLRLGADPRPPGVRRVRRIPRGLRVRVGDYRIVYAVDDARRVVTVGRVALRDKVYKRSRDVRFD